MSVAVGTKAPVFTLPSKPGSPVDLSAHLGRRKTVLLFFPLAFSPVCQVEMCTFRDGWSKWQGLGCDVFGVSVDSPFVVDKFREMEKIPFPLLSDFNKDVARQYGALHEDLMGLKGVAKRAAFVVDASGVIRYAWVSDDPRVQVDFEAIEKAVKAC
jgi:peroxiredoxin